MYWTNGFAEPSYRAEDGRIASKQCPSSQTSRRTGQPIENVAVPFADGRKPYRRASLDKYLATQAVVNGALGYSIAWRSSTAPGRTTTGLGRRHGVQTGWITERERPLVIYESSQRLKGGGRPGEQDIVSFFARTQIPWSKPMRSYPRRQGTTYRYRQDAPAWKNM